MKKLTLAAFAALTLVAIAPAQTGGGTTKQHHNTMHMGSPSMSPHACCMQGLSSSESKNATVMMSKWSADEKAAWDKRCTLCMADPHTALMKMEKSGHKPTDAMVHQHMMSGLSKGEQSAMGKILGDKGHGALVMKMAENCCMYGAKHSAHMGKI
ncbi:MAG: hypothetical protein ACHQ50_06845 [Fimbriimonadales bacterium]